MTAQKYQKRYDFISEMLEKIRSMPIEKIVLPYLNGKTRHSGRHIQCLCPFHKDTKLGSFIITPSRSMWKCFTCGEGYGGDAIKFVSLYLGCDYMDAAFQIALEYRIISEEEFEHYGKKTLVPYKKNKPVKHRITKDEKKEEPVKAPSNVCHNVYSVIKEYSSLELYHRKHLVEERHLSETRIEKDYFSFPSRYSVKQKIIAVIKERFHYSNDLLKMVPGFFYDKEKEELTFTGYKGIGILIRNFEGQIEAIQIRRDQIKKGDSRYIWFSSTFAFYKPELYEGGCGCGSPIDVCMPRNPQKASLCITEGRFKSECLIKTGNISLSLQGVSAWRGVIDTIRNIIRAYHVTRLYLFLDSDIMGKHALFLQSCQLAETLKQLYPTMDILYVFWKKSYGKGIDDCIISGHLSKTRCFTPEYSKAQINSCFDKVLEEFSVESLQELPKEQSSLFEEKLQHLCESSLSL